MPETGADGLPGLPHLIVSARFPPRSAYLHLPFCHRRCFYCDFPVVPLGDRAGGEPGLPGSLSIEAYLTLLEREIATAAAGPPLSTVYLGGGTPSLLTPGQVDRLLQVLATRFGVAPGAEITLELDPASFDQRRLAGYLEVGINRVSLGAQSFDDSVLTALGRRHRGQDVSQASAWLDHAWGKGGLHSWSLDLIQAVPGQQWRDWQAQLRQALACRPPHLSVYDLTIEPGTVFGRRAERGELQLPDEDLAADLMELTWTELNRAGYGHYEISNYALPGHASRHNRVYWSGAAWWGFGMGATGAPSGRREARPRTRQGYADWLDASRPEAIPQTMPVDDLLLVGLRRREGVPLPRLLAQAGLTAVAATRALESLRFALQPWLQAGLLLEEGPRWRLSDPSGLAVSNAVLRCLLGWWADQDFSGWPANCAALPEPGSAPGATGG